MLRAKSLMKLGFLCAAFTAFASSALSAADQDSCLGQTMQAPLEATAFGKAAGDFSLTTTEGHFRMSEQWNSCDVFVFFKTFTVPEAHPSRPLSEQTNLIWQSKFDLLLQFSPRNVHYFFLSQNIDPIQRLKDVGTIQKNLEDALKALPEADRLHWKSRIHIANDDLSQAAWIGTIGLKSFVIDRFQIVRPLGVGAYAPLLQGGDFLKLAMEAQFYNFQWEREKAIASQSGDRVIEIFRSESMQAGWTEFGGTIKEVEFPRAEDMATFDRMLVDLELSCSGGVCVYPDQGIYYYDRVVEVFLCRDESDMQCDLELGRWVTPFGLGGRWVHDISPLLSLFQKGGKQRLRFHTVDQYQVSLKFRLGSSGADVPKPFAYQELFRGAKLDALYNQRSPILFNVPEGTKRIEIVSVTTGHGWGRDVENCAEFCVTDHEWTLNGTQRYVNRLENAGETFACFLATGAGVIPNQPGTWFFGRSGWCPGLEVKPRIWDISDFVNREGTNRIQYRALFKGADYIPVESPEGHAQGYDPEINMRSYVVFSK